MSIARRVAPELPTLRRFARLLAGSQASGDAHVIATLEALSADPSILSPELPARQALYKTFLTLWSSAHPHRRLDSLDRGPGIVAEHNIRAITPLPRQAFLLHAVEGFSIAEVAAVLDKSRDTVNELLAQAGREIAEQVATEVLIIEDEPIIALDIEATMQELGHNVIGIARTHKEAIESVRKRTPGIVLADILLADGSSGLAAVNEILTSINVPVIFITAYPERLLTGKKPEPTYVITKPFRTETVSATVSQALFFGRSNDVDVSLPAKTGSAR